MEIDPWAYPWKLTPGQTHGKMENQPPPPPAAPRGPRRDEHPEQENLNTETRQITRKAATTNIPMEIDPWTDPWKTGKANASALRPDAILLHSRQRALRARDVPVLRIGVDHRTVADDVGGHALLLHPRQRALCARDVVSSTIDAHHN